MTGCCRVSYAITLFVLALTATSVKAAHPVVSLTDDLVLAVLSGDDSGSDQLRTLAKERAEALVGHARSDTALVLNATIPEAVLNRIDASLLEYVEESTELEGHLTVSLRQYDDSSRVHQIILRPAEALDPIILHLDRPSPNLPIGQMVRVRGVLLPTLDEDSGASVRHMVLRADELTVVPDAESLRASPPVGDQRTGVLLVNLNDHSAPPRDLVGKKLRKLRSLLRSHSLGRAWISLEFVDEIVTNTLEECNSAVLHRMIHHEINNLGHKLDELDRIIAFLPDLDCGWRAEASFPGRPTIVLLNGETYTKTHLSSFLYSLGMPSEQAYPCDFDPIHSICDWGEGPEPKYLYGFKTVSINAFHKGSLGWIDVNDSYGITPVEAPGSFEVAASDYRFGGQRLALKLRRPAPLVGLETTYYVEYRARKNRYGERLQPEVVIYIVGANAVTNVLNLTNPDLVPAELRHTIELSAGRFVDHLAGVQVEVVNTDPWAAELDISFDPSSCVRARPDIATAPRETPYLSTETPARFAVAVTSRDSENCEPTRRSLHVQAPNGWSVQQNPETPMLGPGETMQMEVSLTAPSGEGPGFRDLGWIVAGDAPVEADQSTMLFVMPSTGGSKSPVAMRTVNVSNSSQLKSAVSSARPGDHIILANGSYTGFTLSNSGTASNPIVVKAANTGGAKLGQVSLQGDYVILVGVDMGDSTLFVKGLHNRVTKSYFKDSLGASIYFDRAARFAEIDHNEFVGGAGHNGDVNLDVIMVRVSCTADDNHHVHHNYIHHPSSGGSSSDAISTGFGNACNGESLIEYNLVENWGGGKHCLYEKGGKNVWQFNTCIGGGASSRGGLGGGGITEADWIGNWLESGTLKIFGAKNRVIGNHAEIHIGCGNMTPGSSADQDNRGWNAAFNTLVAGNVGKLHIGEIHSSHCSIPATNTSVQVHNSGNGCGQGDISCRNHTGTSFSANTSVSVPTAFRLIPSDVGPNAPTAPKL